ncbi:hypothetical protein MMC19_005077 [Ptychographa xylographoides]|nr:hypothetical protein [Ptychographa xylographoides]
MKNLAIVFSVLSSLPDSYAWGQLGHATIAYIASNFLEPTTVTFAQNILGDTSSSYLANVASWADSYRETSAGKFSEPFHFIDALDSPPKTCDVIYTRDCGSGGCVVSAINNYTTRIQDTKLSATQINQALMFLIHFIGDIHQPLHDENLDLGGNEVDVTFAGTSTNLHAVWDTSIPQKYGGSATLANAQKWATTLTTAIKSGTYKSQAPGWVKGLNLTDPIDTATGWATGANAFVCSVVIPQGVSAVQGKDLSTTYYTSALPTVELQFATAGYRLAAWLNLIATGSTGLTSRSAEGMEAEYVRHGLMKRAYEDMGRVFKRAADAVCSREREL